MSESRDATELLSLLEGDVHRIPAKTQHQSRTLRIQVQDNPFVVLKPKVPGASVTEGETVAPLHIGAGKLGELCEAIDVPRSRDGGRADAPNSDASNAERVGLTIEEKGAGATAGTGYVSCLDLVHFDRAGRKHPLDCLRSGGALLRTCSQGEKSQQADGCRRHMSTFQGNHFRSNLSGLSSWIVGATSPLRPGRRLL
jgi:hypothetical protein